MKIAGCFYRILPAWIILGLNCFQMNTSAQSIGGGVSDIDGNSYKTVIIGNQEWMGENLRTTKLNDGTEIPVVTGSTEWRNLKSFACCWYENDISTKNTVGALYNWHAVGTSKLCPLGWHVPSDAEWTELVKYLGGDKVAGGKLKETGTKSWLSPNEGATNETGFSASSSGTRGFRIGPFLKLGYYSDWWSSTEYLGGTAWERRLHFNTTTVTRNASDKRVDYPVRCIRNK